MTGLVEEYVRKHGGRLEGAEALARDLMRGDAYTFKAGYSSDNAVLAVIDLFVHVQQPLTSDEIDALRSRILATSV